MKKLSTRRRSDPRSDDILHPSILRCYVQIYHHHRRRRRHDHFFVLEISSKVLIDYNEMKGIIRSKVRHWTKV